MKEVHAVTDPGKIYSIEGALQDHHGRQYAQIWRLGINLALRISDLLALRLADVADPGLKTFMIVEGKTKKTREVHINSTARRIITEIITARPTATFLFESHRSPNTKNKPPRPLCRTSVARAFKSVGEQGSISVRLGTHSMRKTRGYHAYKKTGDLALVMRMLNHSSEAHTLRYIGITRETLHDLSSLIEL